MNKRLILIIVLMFFAAFASGLTYTGWLSKTESLQASGDDVFGIIDDPNGSPVFKKISRNAALSSWTGSTAVTTLGTIGTGTWNASFTDAALTAIDAGTWTGAASITTLGTVTTGIWNATVIDEAQLDADVIVSTEIDTFSELDAIVADKALVNKADGAVWLSVHDFSTATSLAVPSAESADATLTALGQIHIRGDEDRFSMHFGAGGEIAGEATISALKKISATFDPGSWYDSSAYVNLGPILAKQYPNGIIIDYWAVTCHLDPDVEMDMDLCYSVNSFDLADPNLVDVMDTTTGVSSEDTDANINAGAAIPAGVYLYLRFGADPEGTCQMLTITILYHGEED